VSSAARVVCRTCRPPHCIMLHSTYPCSTHRGSTHYYSTHRCSSTHQRSCFVMNMYEVQFYTGIRTGFLEKESDRRSGSDPRGRPSLHPSPSPSSGSGSGPGLALGSITSGVWCPAGQRPVLFYTEQPPTVHIWGAARHGVRCGLFCLECWVQGSGYIAESRGYGVWGVTNCNRNHGMES